MLTCRAPAAAAGFCAGATGPGGIATPVQCTGMWPDQLTCCVEPVACMMCSTTSNFLIRTAVTTVTQVPPEKPIVQSVLAKCWL